MALGNSDPEYILARRVLLDALEALGANIDAVVLVGAQAIYMHTGDADLAVAETTTDGDLAIDPSALVDNPRLAAAMQAGHFVLGANPGEWLKKGLEGGDPAIRVDLMVPEALGGSGRRGARLGVHGRQAARKARGLEATLLDNERHTITALEQGDNRSFQIRVANPPALLVAKLHKFGERVAEGKRILDKDALDVLRILRKFSTATLAVGLRELIATEQAGEVTREAIAYLEHLFGSPGAAGTQAVVRATAELEDPGVIEASVVALASRLLNDLDDRGNDLVDRG